MLGVGGTKPRDRRRGHGTFPTDRPPVVGRSGRGPGEVRLDILELAYGATLETVIEHR